MNSSIARTVSARLTVLLRMPEAAREPRLTVTIQSKLFICDVVRLPEIRTAKTITRYSTGTEIRTRTRSAAESKKTGCSIGGVPRLAGEASAPPQGAAPQSTASS